MLSLITDRLAWLFKPSVYAQPLPLIELDLSHFLSRHPIDFEKIELPATRILERSLHAHTPLPKAKWEAIVNAEGFEALFKPGHLDFEGLGLLARALARPEFLDLFRVREFSSPHLGQVYSPCLDESSADYLALKALVGDFVNRHCRVFLAKFKQLERIDEAVEHVSLLSFATCPAELSPEAKAAHAHLTTWLYLIDDAVGKLRTKVQESALFQNWFPAEHWLSAYISNLNSYCIACMEAGLLGQVCPSLPDFKTLLRGHSLSASQARALRLLNAIKGRLFSSMGLLGQVLYACMSELAKLSPCPEHLGEESKRLTFELKRYFAGLVEEMQVAPTEVSEYLERHSGTGAVRPCLELNALLLAWHLGISPKLMQGLSPELRYQALRAADFAVLCSNEICFIKDLGEEEESLVALMTAQHLRQQGDLEADFRLDSQKAHGQILWDYGHSPAAFSASRQVFSMLEANALELLANSKRLEQSQQNAENQAAASAFGAVLLRWALGYALLNPLTKRYGMSYPLQKALLNNDQADFEAIVLQAKANLV